MKINGTFKTKDFRPGAFSSSLEIQIRLPIGFTTMEKQYFGQIEGRAH